MATYYRKANVIKLEDKKTVFESFDSINAAKRYSHNLQKTGDSVFVIPVSYTHLTLPTNREV